MADQHDEEAEEVARVEQAARIAALRDAEQERMTEILLARGDAP
ncbi:hypothetical protein M446_5914 [Methylobacterium sp. 4-46]|nr:MULTISPECIES: hypothetical protein [Methylobacterium]ACA20195.1 hypothetical protein M446_5914 [Methylobacterium sp. 4-46]WFT79375.1 hypothetical protein QA634_29865 [Methylobacterium nodulans]